MRATDALLLAALQAAPRRYRMPPLPPDAHAARAAGVDTSLAFAIDAARLARDRGMPAPAAARELFLAALAAFIRAALQPQGGDPAFQAQLLQAQDATVREFAALSTQEGADRRAVRALADAVAHPGKLRALAPGASRDALARLHALAGAAEWPQLRAAAAELLAGDAALDAGARAALGAIHGSAALQRLARRGELLPLAPVQRYLALCAQRGPLAGSHAAAAQGRASARTGDAAERSTIESFERIARLLDARVATGRHRVERGLRPPRGFPGAAGKAKDEWDAAILHDADADADAAGADIVLLAEVKASPAAATSDFARLQRGLQRLAQADAQQVYEFASADSGGVRIAGASLRTLQPLPHALPPQVIYCCTAPVEARPAPLSAASKAVLGAEAASLDYAGQLAAGAEPSAELLAPVWDALTQAPRLRATLHQYQTASAAREAMLHPADLLDALAAAR